MDEQQNTSGQIAPKGDAIDIIKSVESTIAGVTVRGWIALILVTSIVIYPFCKITIPDVVSNLCIAAVAYYFGKNQSK